jgi:hypothetical protein
MKTEYKYIRFMCIGDTGKTSRWSIHNNRSNGFLGEIKWYSAWRQYCFYTTSDAVFNDSCMLDILDFIKQLTAAHNSGAAKNGPATRPAVHVEIPEGEERFFHL